MIRVLASALFVTEIIETEKSLRIKIDADCIISRERIVHHLASDKRFFTDPLFPDTLIFHTRGMEVHERIALVREWLIRMS